MDGRKMKGTKDSEGRKDEWMEGKKENVEGIRKDHTNC